MNKLCLLIFLLIFILLISNLTFAATFEQVTLEEGQSVKVAGKTILLETAYYDFIIVQVDGNKKTIQTFEAEDEEGFIVYRSHTTYANGVNITIIDITGRNKAILNISVAFDCGDGTCGTGENQKICCEDCNCSAGLTCVDNQCIESVLNECFSDAECNDSNLCTFDACIGLPRNCSYVAIDYCRDYDSCCPEICMYENDTDCPRNKTTYECFSWHDCKKPDQSLCNLSACESGKCVYEIQQGCAFNDTCVAINSTILINGTNFTCKQQGLVSLEGKEIKEIEGGRTGFKKYLWLFILLALLIIVIIFLIIYYKLFSIFSKKDL